VNLKDFTEFAEREGAIGAVRELDVTDVGGRLYVGLVEFMGLGLARPPARFRCWLVGVLHSHVVKLIIRWRTRWKITRCGCRANEGYRVGDIVRSAMSGAWVMIACAICESGRLWLRA